MDIEEKTNLKLIYKTLFTTKLFRMKSKADLMSVMRYKPIKVAMQPREAYYFNFLMSHDFAHEQASSAT